MGRKRRFSVHLVSRVSGGSDHLRKHQATLQKASRLGSNLTRTSVERKAAKLFLQPVTEQLAELLARHTLVRALLGHLVN